MELAKVEDLLARVEMADLYEFLKLDRHATPAQLCNAAERVFNSIQNKGQRGRPWDDQKELTGLCKKVFRDAESKREYDRTLTEAKAAGDQQGRTEERRAFDESAVLLETGWNFIRQGRVEEAVAIARRLRGDYQECSRLRLTVAELLMETRDVARRSRFSVVVRN